MRSEGNSSIHFRNILIYSSSRNFHYCTVEIKVMVREDESVIGTSPVQLPEPTSPTLSP